MADTQYIHYNSYGTVSLRLHQDILRNSLGQGSFKSPEDRNKYKKVDEEPSLLNKIQEKVYDNASIV